MASDPPGDCVEILKLVPDLGPGEAAVLTIGLQEPTVSTLLLDDGLARSPAKLHNLKFTGTLGVLLRGKREGLVAEIRPLLLDLRRVDFHLSTPLLERTLARSWRAVNTSLVCSNPHRTPELKRRRGAGSCLTLRAIAGAARGGRDCEGGFRSPGLERAAGAPLAPR
ncbi:MAG: DUF3368 domain-containing protein [Vulcanimicrobiota bacterium]